MINIYFDGACWPINPGGTATYGFFIKNEDRLIYSSNGIVGSGRKMSNNVAEYAAVIAAIKYILDNNLNEQNITFFGDSKLVICQLSGLWKAKSGLYKSYFLKAKRLVKKLKSPVFTWIPREQNSLADKLSKM